MMDFVHQAVKSISEAFHLLGLKCPECPEHEKAALADSVIKMSLCWLSPVSFSLKTSFALPFFVGRCRRFVCGGLHLDH